jgi:hypothetical protein
LRSEKRRYQARNLGEEQVELLIFDKNELEHENKKPKNLLEWKSKKFEDENLSLKSLALLLICATKWLVVVTPTCQSDWGSGRWE